VGNYSPSDNRIVHNRFVRLVLEIAIPTTLEVWRRPAFNLLQLLCGRTNLDTSVNSVSCQRAGTLQVPFIKDCLLDFGNTAYEVVKTLGVW